MVQKVFNRNYIDLGNDRNVNVNRKITKGGTSMNKEKMLKKVADLGQKVAVKANGKTSFYLMFQPKEPNMNLNDKKNN
jgi:cyclic lactone autoinducer peptide